MLLGKFPFKQSECSINRIDRPGSEGMVMDQEKRKGRKAIPDNFRKLLNRDQKEALNPLKKFGWEICFVRMPLFQPLVVALHNNIANRYALLLEDGGLDLKTNLKVRH